MKPFLAFLLLTTTCHAATIRVWQPYARYTMVDGAPITDNTFTATGPFWLHQVDNVGSYHMPDYSLDPDLIIIYALGPYHVEFPLQPPGGEQEFWYQYFKDDLIWDTYNFSLPNVRIPEPTGWLMCLTALPLLRRRR